MNDEELDAVLGANAKSYTKFRALTVDNGSDIIGTGATGAFVEKGDFDQTTGMKKKIPYAKTFEGVIIAQRVQLSDIAKVPAWQTEEFDSSNKNHKIAVYPLSDGKWIKDPNGGFKKNYATYAEIQEKKSTRQPDGTSKNAFSYGVILYVAVNDEVLKLKFKGTSRGNFFDYSKSIGRMRAKLHNVFTTFTSYMDKATAKYAINFAVALDANGAPKTVDLDAIRPLRVQVAQSFLPYSGSNAIEAPKQQAISEPDYSQPATQDAYSQVDNSDIRPEEVINIAEDREDIDISEIPWDNK